MTIREFRRLLRCKGWSKKGSGFITGGLYPNGVFEATMGSVNICFVVDSCNLVSIYRTSY